MSISASGAIFTASGTGTASLGVSSFPRIGDMLMVTTHIASATVHIASLSAPGVTTWTHVGGAVSGTHSVDVWLGPVTNENAISSITFTGSAAITATVNSYTGQIFTAGGQGTSWSVDGSLATLNNAASSTTITYPTLTPAGSAELYFGYGIATGTPALTTGATAGYTVAVDGANNAVMYNPGVSAVQSPTTLQTSSAASFSLGCLIVATPPAAGTVQQVGSLKTNSGTAISTLAVTPVTVGNLLVVAGGVKSATIHYTTLSGGGVTTWTHLVGPFVGTSGTWSQDMWMGVVTTAGSSTITFSASGALTGLTTGMEAQEFTVNNSAVTWALDTTGTSSNTASTTLTFPSMTPALSGEIYMGMCASAGGVNANTQPANYTSIQVPLNFTAQSGLYNPQLGTGAQSPTMTQTSGLSWAVGVLIQGTLPATPVTQPLNRARLIRASCW